MKETLLAALLFCCIMSASAMKEEEVMILEKDGIYYELLRGEDGKFNHDVNVVGWVDGKTELDITNEVDLEFPKDEAQIPTCGIGDDWPTPGNGHTWKCKVIIFYSKPRMLKFAAGKSSDITNILLGSNIKVNGTFSEYSNLRNINLPAKVEEIPDSMFFGCKSLTDIIVPSTVHTIGTGAFADCANLKNVSFAEASSRQRSLFIGVFAFQGCSSLESVTLPQGCSVTFGSFDSCEKLAYVSFELGSQLTSNPFTRCPRLKSVVFRSIGDGYEVQDGLILNKTYGRLCAAFPSTISRATIPAYVKTIGLHAFAYCSELKNIVLPYQIESIEYQAFAFSGLESVDTGDLFDFGEGEESYRFEGCPRLTKVRVGKNFNRLYAGDFQKCGSLREFVVSDENEIYETENGILYSGSRLVCVPAALETVSVREGTLYTDIWSFCSNTKLVSVALPNSLESIGDNSFQGCSALKSIEIPEKVKGIFSGTFCFCTGLEEVRLRGVQKFRDWVFEGCDNLKSLYIYTPDPPEAYYSDEEDGVFPEVMFENTIVYVPDGCVDKYRASSLWNRFKTIKGFTASVEDVDAETLENAPTEVFSVSGIKVSDGAVNLPAGIYVVRKGTNVSKKIVW